MVTTRIMKPLCNRPGVWVSVICCFGGALSIPFVAVAQSPGAVAVMQFVNLNQQLADDWIGVGIAETVASDLQSLGISVVGKAEVRDAVGEDQRAPGRFITDLTFLTASRAVGARWLVVGAYQRLGALIRITVRLVDVETGVVSRRGKVDGSLADIFLLQDQIVSILGGEIIRTRPVDDGASVADAIGAVELEDAKIGTMTRNADGSSSEFAATLLGEAPRTVIHRTTDPPELDGRLDDAVWQTATHITEFVQIAPVAGAPGTEETEAWMAFDSENIYFAFYAHYSDMGMLRVNRTDRDQMGGDDQMSVLFDPFLDQQRAYQFEVNGYGVQGDSLVNADGSSGRSFSQNASSQSGSRSSGSRRSGGDTRSNSGSFGIRGDSSWNALFDTAGRVVDDGWIAEMAIPFKSVRYPMRGLGESHRWGLQITRRIRGRAEAQSWSPVSRDVAGQLTQFGILEGLEGLSESRNLEVLPEITGVRFGTLDRNTGDYNTRDPDGDIGVGIKYGITPNLTADVTYNPDFSQIESDRPQIETNQRFSLFFPEQRPFFLEGQEIFQTSTSLALLHTRTIIDPRFGGKLTGKVGNTTLGVIVVDDEEAGRLDERADPRFGTTAQTVVGRARYDFYSESYLGAIMTAREFGQEYNRVGGIDGRFRLGSTHRVSFMAAGSSTRNETEGSLGGPVFEADFARQGRNLGYSASYGSIDPKFRTESGFLPRVDFRQANGTVSYRWWPESSLITWGPSFTYFRLYDHAGVLQDEQIQGQASFQFRNNMAVTGTVNRDLERFREIDFRRTGYGLNVVLVSRPRVGSVVGFNTGDGILFSDNPYLGRSTTGNLLFQLRPFSRLQTMLTGVFSRFVDVSEGLEVFNVKIYRLRTTYQFTERFGLRHIMEHNTQAVTLGNNFLLTYRINAGTVVFLGYDDRYQRGTRINDTLFPLTVLQRTNRAVFAKVSYLFRY